MQVKSAIKQSKKRARSLVLPLVILVIAYAWLRWWQLAALAGLTGFYLLGEVTSFLYRQRRARADPSYLEKRLY
jgi:hypothetical protein